MVEAAQAQTALLRCPICRSPLASAETSLECAECARSYPLEHAIADFSGGDYYDRFDGPSSLNPAQRRGLENEIAGTTARVHDFYGPLLRRHIPATAGRSPRVLDSGCGNGVSIELLSDLGLEAWGNDISALRKWQWQERLLRHRLVVAPSQSLPFADGTFDAVLSSGVIEHIGVDEEGGDHYRVAPRPDCDDARVAFLRELVRVLGPGGRLYVDCPNGAFPIDFWHGTVPGGARVHSLREGFLPTVAEIRAYLRTIGDFHVRALGPARRLRMRQVGQHWFGRLLRLPMQALLAAMAVPGLRWLAGSPLNPYLVLEIQRAPRRR